MPELSSQHGGAFGGPSAPEEITLDDVDEEEDATWAETRLLGGGDDHSTGSDSAFEKEVGEVGAALCGEVARMMTSLPFT